MASVTQGICVPKLLHAAPTMQAAVLCTLSKLHLRLHAVWSFQQFLARFEEEWVKDEG